MLIQRNLLFKGSLGEATLSTLFDSGAIMSCIHPEKVKNIENPVKLRDSFKIGTAAANTFLEINQYVPLIFEIDGKQLIDVFIVIPNLNAEVVIGVDTLQKYHTKLNFETGEILLDPNAGRLLLM